MTGATTWCVVYNNGENGQAVDDEGRTIYPTEFTWARRSQIRDLVNADLLQIVDMDNIRDDSNPAARMAKEKATQLNDAIDAEKATDAAEEEPDEPKQAEEKPTSSSRKRTSH